MFKTLPIGRDNFKDIIERNAYYVDKTELMYELVHDTNNKVTLFTRPRRFGKTLMMSMMENFFSIRKDNRSIFEGLAITEHKDFCKDWMNQYPVLFVSYANNSPNTRARLPFGLGCKYRLRAYKTNIRRSPFRLFAGY